MKPITAQPVSWIESAPVRIVEQIEVAASADDVFAVIADHESWPEWFDNLVSITAGGTNEVGGTRQVTLRGGLVFDEEFIEWEPGRRFGFHITAMNRPLMESISERVEIEPLADDRCRVTYTQGFEAKWWSKPLLAVLRSQFRKGLRAGLEGLRARAET